MRKILLFFLLPCFAFAQEAQWASEVLGVSSERMQDPVGLGYKAIQALGPPDKLPAFGESPNGWSPATAEARFNEWIKVGFAKPQPVAQVAIAENFGAGSIAKVWLYGTGGEEVLAFRDDDNLPSKGRLKHIYVDRTSFLVKAVKVELTTVDVEGWNQIDAIAISEGTTPVQATIQQSNSLVVQQAEPLSQQINSFANEVLPVVAADGRTLYFDRKNHTDNTPSARNNDDIWMSEWNGSYWTDPVRMPAPLNNADHNYVCSVSPDGGTLVLGNIYGQNGNAGRGLSISRKTSSGWEMPQALNIENHYNWSRTGEYCMANNSRIIIMTVQRKDTEGGKDLYASFLKAGNNWTEPIHLGNTINSASDELAPFLASDNKTLYFSSEGFSGYGEADIFVSRRLDSTWTNWSPPLNVGPIFNGSGPDVSFAIDAAGEYAYFSSDKSGGHTDLFRAKLPKEAKPDPVVLISGTVYNAKTKQPIGAKILYESLPSGKSLGSAFSDQTSGAYKITVPFHESYGFFASAEGYISVDDNLDLQQTEEVYYEVKRDLYLVPFEEGQVIRLNNVFFEQSKPDLLEASFPELKRLAQTLIMNPKMEIVIEGHTDIDGKPGENMKLSKERVKVVKEFLVKEGVPEKRIDTEAFGDTKPITKDRSEASKKLNRRVEVRIRKM